MNIFVLRRKEWARGIIDALESPTSNPDSSKAADDPIFSMLIPENDFQQKSKMPPKNRGKDSARRNPASTTDTAGTIGQLQKQSKKGDGSALINDTGRALESEEGKQRQKDQTVATNACYDSTPQKFPEMTRRADSKTEFKKSGGEKVEAGSEVKRQVKLVDDLENEESREQSADIDAKIQKVANEREKNLITQEESDEISGKDRENKKTLAQEDYTYNFMTMAPESMKKSKSTSITQNSAESENWNKWTKKLN